MSKTKRDTDKAKMSLEMNKVMNLYTKTNSEVWNTIWLEFQRLKKKYPKVKGLLHDSRPDIIEDLLIKRKKIESQLKKELKKELEEMEL